MNSSNLTSPSRSRGGQSPFQVHKLLLKKDSIAKIQTRLGDYRKSILYLFDFVNKSQKFLEHHMTSLSLSMRSSAIVSNSQEQQQMILQSNAGGSQGIIANQLLLNKSQPLHFRMASALMNSTSTFTKWNPLFPLNTKNFENEISSEIEAMITPQSSLALNSIATYKEFELEFFKQLQKYKEQCRVTQTRIDKYASVKLDVNVLYNPKELQQQWEKLEREYAALLERQSTYEDYFDLIQTKKKALGINLEELMLSNQNILGNAIRVVHTFLQRATPSFPMFFFFYSNSIQEYAAKIPTTQQIQQSMNQSQIDFIIPKPDHFQSKSLQSNRSIPRKFPNFLYMESQWNDRLLSDFYSLTVTYIQAIETESIERQQQVRSSLKSLDVLRGQLERSGKSIQDCLSSFSEKEKANMFVLLGIEESYQLQGLLSIIESSANALEKQSQIVAAVRDHIAHHLANLQACHKQVFTALHKSLVDHHSLRSQFIRILDFKSQYSYTSTSSTSAQQSQQQQQQQLVNQLNQTDLFSSQLNINQQQQQSPDSSFFTQPNFKQIRQKIVHAIPLLQECIISLLNDFERTFVKEMNGVRQNLDKVIQSIISSCKEVIERKVQEERLQQQKLLQQQQQQQLHPHSMQTPRSSSRLNASNNSISKLSEETVATVTSRILREDEAFRLFYSDLKEEIDQLHIDFVKEDLFDFSQIARLQPPANSHPLKSPAFHSKKPSKNNINNHQSNEQFDDEDDNFNDQDENVSFLSFSHDPNEIEHSKQYFRNFNQSDDVTGSVDDGEEEKTDKHFDGSATSSSDWQARQGSSQRFLENQETQQYKASMEEEDRSQKEDMAPEEAFLKKRTHWGEGEELKHHYSCAFSQNISLQGRMYVTNQRLIFQSYFNASNLFFNETLLEIPKADILKIHKKKNMLRFDNAIQIDVAKGSLLFTQFIYRDNAFDSIVKVLRPAEMISTIGNINHSVIGNESQFHQSSVIRTPQRNREDNFNPHESHSQPKSANGLTTPRQDKNLGHFDQQELSATDDSQVAQLLEQRKAKVNEALKRNDGMKHLIFDSVLKGDGITIQDLFQSCISDTKYKHSSEAESEEFPCYFHYYILKVMKCWNVSLTDWTPAPPAYFQEGVESCQDNEEQSRIKYETWTEFIERKATYDKTIPFSGIPFLPKSCAVLENQKIIFVNPNELVFELEAYSSGVPLSDTFYIVIRSTFKKIAHDTLSYKIQMNVKFMKSSWLAGTVESQSIKEGEKSSQEIANHFQQRLNKFLHEKRLQQQLQTQKQQQVQHIHRSISTSPAVQKQSNQEQQQQLRKQRITREIGPLDIYKFDIFSHQFSHEYFDISVRDIFSLLFSDDQKYKNYNDFFEFMKVSVFEDTEYVSTRFSPAIPDSFASPDNHKNKTNGQIINFDVQNEPDCSTRQLNYIHKLPPTKIPFMPKTCKVKEVIKVYWISPEHIVITIEAFTTGIPKGDTFTVRVAYDITSAHQNSVSLVLKSYVHFTESSFLQSTIESNSIEQQRIQAENMRVLFIKAFDEFIQAKQLKESHQQNIHRSPTRESSILTKGKHNHHSKKSSPQTRKYKYESNLQQAKSLIEERTNRIINSMESIDNYKSIMIDQVFKPDNENSHRTKINAMEFAQLLFGEMHVHKGYRDFSEYLKVSLLSETGFTCQEFVPPMPSRDLFSNSINLTTLLDEVDADDRRSHSRSSRDTYSEELEEFIATWSGMVDSCEREMNYIHPVPENNIPFMPKTCKVREVTRMNLISPALAIVNTEVFTSGIPKGDSFTIRIRIEIRQVDAYSVHLTQRTYVHFRESTFLAGKIEKNSMEQQKITSEGFILPAMKIAFKELIEEKQQKHLAESANQKKIEARLQNQYSLRRIKSIKIEDEDIFEESEDEDEIIDASETTNQRHSSGQARRGRKKESFKKRSNSFKENELVQMNSKLKQIIIAFFVIYLATIAFYFIKK